MGYRMIIRVLSGLYVYAVAKVLSRTNKKASAVSTVEPVRQLPASA